MVEGASALRTERAVSVLRDIPVCVKNFFISSFGALSLYVCIIQ